MFAIFNSSRSILRQGKASLCIVNLSVAIFRGICQYSTFLCFSKGFYIQMFTITLSSQEKCHKFKQKYFTWFLKVFRRECFRSFRFQVFAGFISFLTAVGVFSLAFPREQNRKLVKSKKTKKRKKIINGILTNQDAHCSSFVDERALGKISGLNCRRFLSFLSPPPSLFIYLLI